MKRFLYVMMAAVILVAFISAYPTAFQANTYTYEKVVADILNVRTSPSLNASIVGKLNQGDQVKVIKTENDWSKISFNTITGWVANEFLQPIEKTGVTTATSLNVRSDASILASRIDALEKGTYVSVLEEKYGWSKIQYDDGTGWVATQYISTSNVSVQSSETVTLTSNNVNLRSGPGTNFSVIVTANKGTQYNLVDRDGDWLKIQLGDGSYAWVASWLTTCKNDATTGIEGKNIVLDAGHGGRDAGTSGSIYQEKILTLSTVQLAASLLKQAGANVILARESDAYVSLSDRVKMSHSSNADAFISFHYNSGTSTSSGIMTFYYTESKDKELAQSIQSALIRESGLNDLGVRYGNYQVLRENQNPSVLVELGFLSNPSEEKQIGSLAQQQKAAQAIANGIIDYFN